MGINSEVIKEYLNINLAGGADFNPVKNEIVYVCDLSGNLQIYTMDLYNNEIIRISNREDRCTNPTYLEDGSILYSSDFGGNENFQFFTYNQNETSQLTKDNDAKHRFGFATEKNIFFSANIIDKSRFDVYKYDLPVTDKSEPILIREGEEFIPFSPLCISPDNNLLVLSRTRSNMANDLIIFNIKKKENTEITSDIFGDHNSSFNAIEFVSNDVLLVISDHRKEFRTLALLNTKTKELNFLEEDKWDTPNALFDQDSGKVIFEKNIEAGSHLYFARIENGKLLDKEELKLPDPYGDLISGDLRSFERSTTVNKTWDKILITYSSATKITNVWQIDLKSKKLKKITDYGNPNIDYSTFIPAELKYFNSFDNLKVPYFIYTPKNTNKAKLPTLLIIHGGPEAQMKANFFITTQLFVNQGFIVVTPNIRGSRGYGRKYLALDDIDKRLDSIHDIQALTDHLRATNNLVDPDKFIILGGSYGGYSVLSSITEYPTNYACAIDIVGMSNLVTFLENTAKWRRKLREVEYGSLDLHRDILKRNSPIHKINEVKTPTLIIQGDNDERVPLTEAIQVYEEMKKNNVSSELLRFSDEGHGIVKRKNQIIEYQKIFEFLEKNL